jgi:hypothetical protein
MNFPCNCVALGPTTQIFDDVKWGADASSRRDNTFSEFVRCPLEAWGGVTTLASLLSSRKVRSSKFQVGGVSVIEFDAVCGSLHVKS